LYTDFIYLYYTALILLVRVYYSIK